MGDSLIETLPLSYTLASGAGAALLYGRNARADWDSSVPAQEA